MEKNLMASKIAFKILRPKNCIWGSWKFWCTACIIAILIQVSVTLKELGLDNPSGYHIQDLFDNHNYGTVTPDRRFKVDVNPSGSEYRVSLM